MLPVRIRYQKIAGLRAPVHRKSINLRIIFFGIAKTSATSQWALDSKNNDMTTVTKKPQDARELKVHTAGEGESLVQLTFFPKNSERAIDRYALAGTPSFVREA